MKNLLVLMLAVFVIWFATAQADDRITRIAEAISQQDPIAAQADFSRSTEAARRSAELGKAAEAGGRLTVRQAKRVMPLTYGARVVDTAGNEYVWVLIECESESKWCYWDTRPAKEISGAMKGQAADVATTAIGLALGASEANPIGLVPVLLYKGALLAGSTYGTFEQCMAMKPGLEVAGYGPAAMNLVTLAGLPTGLGIAAMVATMFYTWDKAVENALFDCTDIALN